ncbi:MAG: single-stranded DNA-binding protein, partial [Planctomycetes bacterium]|nr:single-stranded DNA-binding protein [Planctomycetota bacterium]
MAGSFNKVIIMGNITRDPELRYTPQGKAVADITVAVNDARGARSAEAADSQAVFVDVTVWERTAEIVCEYMRKGRPILVEGRLTQDRWDDRDTGKKMSKLKVGASNVQFVDSPRSSEDGGAPAPRQYAAPAPRQAPAAPRRP